MSAARSARSRGRILPARARRGVGPCVVVLACAVLAVVLGASWEHVAMLAAVVVAVVLLWVCAEYAGETRWAKPPRQARDGARRDVAELGWAIVGRDGRVRDRAARRVLALAGRELERHGLGGDLADPATARTAADLLDARTVDGLHRVALGGPAPTPRELETWVEAIERLARAPRPTHPEGTPR